MSQHDLAPAAGHSGQRLPADLRAAFVCNNVYHLAVARSVAQSIEAKWDLYLFGRPEILQGAEGARLPVWRNRQEWFHDGSLRSLLAMPAREISHRLGQLGGEEYDFVFYFIDKEPTNQLFLRRHPESRKVLIQEGIGLYNRVPMPWRERAKKSLVWSWKFRTWLRCRGSEQGANLYHDHVVARWPQALPPCKVGTAEVHGYEQAMPAGDFLQTNEKARTHEIAGAEECVLFVGSPVVNLGWVSSQREAEIVRSLVRTAERAGSTFCVKPHPREPAGKYEQIDPRIQVLHDKEPVESFCMQQRPPVILSFMSSALLNLCYQPRLIYLYDLIDRDFPNKAILKRLRGCGCAFDVPKTIEQAEEIILAGHRLLQPNSDARQDEGPFIKDVIARIVENA
jgi:hypothetical protein